MSIIFLPLALILRAFGAPVLVALVLSVLVLAAVLLSTTKSPLVPNAANSLGRAIGRQNDVTDRSKHVLFEILATALLVIVGLSLISAGRSDSSNSGSGSDNESGASSSCTTAVQSIGAGTKVIDFAGPLSTGCSSLEEYDSAFAAAPDLPYSADVLLVFCSPSSINEFPTATYDSTLCVQARSAGRAGVR